MKRVCLALVLALTCAGMATSHALAQTAPRLITAVDWSGRGVWLRADFHAHTRFSDGVHQLAEVATAAFDHGCDVATIADHTDPGLKAATPEYMDAIRAARESRPDRILLTAIEWNVPPGKGKEHATVLLPSDAQDSAALVAFKQQFDDEKRKDGTNAPGNAADGLAALKTMTTGDVQPVVIVNHPSRAPDSPSAPITTFADLKNAAPALVIGFEGGPGHQRRPPIAGYPPNRLVDRWDVLTDVGGAWDQWLRQGLDVWAAVADSDFHGEDGDFWPCEFASTWVYAPERTGDGVLRALHAGTFFGEHGHIVEGVELQARIEGLPRAAIAGETVAVRAGTKATLTMTFKTPATDYSGAPNRIDVVELIGSTSTETRVLFSGPPGDAAAFEVPVDLPPDGLVVRARGRRVLEAGGALMFQTNPIRLVTSAS